MHPALTLLLLFTMPKLLAASPDTTIDNNRGTAGRATPPVILVKSARLRAVQEVADAFSEGCRVYVKQIDLGDRPSDQAEARELAQGARVLVAVGQPAVEVMFGLRAHIVYALAPDPPRGAIGTDFSASPIQVFQALRHVKPNTHRIAVITSPRGINRMALARSAARSMGIELIELPADGSPSVIRALRALFVPGADEVEGPPRAPVDAVWLGVDPQIIDTQVMAFVAQIQILGRVPVVAATRQQVASGALLAVDWPLEAVGRHLAWQVNQLLEDPDHIELVEHDRPSSLPEAVINAQVAHLLGIPVEPLRHTPGWKVIER